MTSILEKLRSLREVAPSVAVAASDGDGPRNPKDKKLAAKVLELSAENDHYKQLLDKANATNSRNAFVLPIVDRASALKAQSAYTPAVLLRIPVSLPTLADIVEEVIEAMAKYGVDPLPGMVDIVSVFREVAQESYTTRKRIAPEEVENLTL